MGGLTGGLPQLALAMASFIGAHVILSSRPIRDPIVSRLGANGFVRLYSAIVAIALLWTILAYRDAPYVEIWFAGVGLRHITLSAMMIAAILIVASFSLDNPAVAGAPTPRWEDGPKGIFRITRYPFLWGVAFWAASHLLANGDAASIILFAGFGAFAVFGALHIDARKCRLFGAAWESYARQSSHLPFLAVAQGRTRLVWSEIGVRPIVIGLILYLALLVAHEPVIGIAPLPQVSGLFTG